jgi:hypothetical protein
MHVHLHEPLLCVKQDKAADFVKILQEMPYWFMNIVLRAES